MPCEPINPGYLQPGTKVGEYEIRSLVAHGGFGFLYRVARGGNAYALKLSSVRPADLAPEDRLDREERFGREVAALQTLHHANIVRVHSFEHWPGLEDGYPYLVMDFVDGDRLYDWLAKTSPSLRLICETVLQITGAVAYMHEGGICHRDLKSDNILVRRADGAPIIVDFGIARPVVSHPLTSTCTSLGTETHYAPEYAAWQQSEAFREGQAFEWKPTSDLHSLGYVFYELLTGSTPFPPSQSGAGFTAILRTICTCIPILPSVRTNRRVPEALDKIVMRLLEKDPTARYQTAGEVAAAIREALDQAGPEWDLPHDVVPRDARKLTPQPAKATSPIKVFRPGDGLVTRSGQGTGEVDAGPADLEVLDAARMTDEAGGVSDGYFPVIPADSSPPDTSARRRFDEPGAELPSSGDGGFEEPTAVRVSFTGIHRPAPMAQPPDLDAVPIMASAIRKQAEELDAASRKGKPNYLIVGGGAATGLVILLLLLAARGSGKHVEDRHADLLADVERQRAEEAKAVPLVSVESSVLATPMRVGDVVAAVLPRAAAAKGTRNQDAADIDAEMRRNFGRPTIAPAVRNEAAVTEEPSWLKRSTRIDPGTTRVAMKGLGVPLGSHIRARLLSNLDSRTIAGAPVEVILSTPFLVGDRVILPARTLMYGQASTSAGRFTVQFTRIRLPDNSEVEFSGLALDRGDGKAGLRASRRITSETDSGPGIGERVAKSAATTAVNGVSVTGGVADDIGKGASTAVINNRDQVLSSGENAILLDAPVILDVFVLKTF